MGLEESAAALRLVEKHKTFYRKAFEDNSQNALWQYIQEYNVALYSDMLKKHYGLKELPEDLLSA